MRVSLTKMLLERISDRPLIHDSILSLVSNGVGRIGGLVASVVIAAQYGANVNTDAFYMVLVFYTFFISLFQGILDLSFIPVYSEVRSKKPLETRKLLGSTVISLLLMTMGVTIIIDFFMWYLTSFFLVNTTQEATRLVVRLTWEMSPLIIGFVISALFVAVFNAERWFFVAGLMPILPSLGIIISIFLFKEALEIHALSAGLLVGTLFQIVTMYLFFTKKDSKLEFVLYHPDLLRIVKLALPPLLALSLFGLMPIVDRMIVSFFLSEGNVTALENATRLSQIPWSLATVGYINVFFSWWSRKNSDGDLAFVSASFRKLFVLSCGVFIPISLLLFSLSLPLVKIAFGYGKYSTDAIIATSDVFGYLCLGYWALMLRSTLIRFYSAQHNTLVIAKAAVWDFCVHLLVSLLLIKTIGIATIGIATSIGYCASLGYLIAYYFKFKKATTVSIDYVKIV